MYSLVSLVDFLDKHRNRLTGDQVSQIMKRAEGFSNPDSFHEGALGMIFEDAELVRQFLAEVPKLEVEIPPDIEFGFSPMSML